MAEYGIFIAIGAFIDSIEVEGGRGGEMALKETSDILFGGKCFDRWFGPFGYERLHHHYVSFFFATILSLFYLFFEFLNIQIFSSLSIIQSFFFRM